MQAKDLLPDERYDVVVAGAGPGGAVAARAAARRGLRTLLLERRREIGVPLACAEAVRREGLDRLTAIDPAWIASPIDGGRLIVPGGTAVTLERPGAGMVLERPLFERHLAAEAAAAGAEVLVDAAAVEVLRGGGVVVRSRGRSLPVRAEVVIAADGVESNLAVRAGVARPLPRDEFYACAQFLVVGRGGGDGAPPAGWNVVERTADFLVGNRVAPGGYAWRFPKGRGRWNVGVAVTPADAGEESPAAILRRFLATELPGARILGYAVGAIPAPSAPGPFAADGLLLVGDAARLTEPLSGAGIAIAMESGMFAAEAAAEAIGRGDASARGLASYEERWRDERGREVAFYARARAFFRRLGDGEIDRVGRALARVVAEHAEPAGRQGRPGAARLGAFDLGRSLVTADPRLLLLGRHLLAA